MTDGPPPDGAPLTPDEYEAQRRKEDRQRPGQNGNHGHLSPTGRVLPHSIEAEECLLSACLLDGITTLEKCQLAQLSARSFYDTKHGIVYDRILRMAEEGKPIETFILAEELKSHRELDHIGGFAFITQVSSRLPTSLETPYYIAKVRELALLRDVIRNAVGTVEEAYNFTGEIDQFTAAVRRRTQELAPAPPDDSEWPAIVTAAALSAAPPRTPPVLIAGILYEVGTMLLSGPSKAHKTFAALDCAIAIATGASWLNRQCSEAPVLYLNLELQDFAINDRIEKICSARGCKIPDSLHVWNLRGREVNLLSLTARLPAEIKRLSIKATFIDPHYKISSVSGMEENSNDDQGKLLTLLEGICLRSGSALINTHHFAKGDASTKNAIDRASGGGVFARWGDVMLTFTPHEESDAMTVEMSLRNFAPVQSFVVRWEYPRWATDGRLDPADLKTSRGPKEKNTADSAFNALGDGLLGYSEWLKASRMSETTFKRKRQELLDENRVELVGICYRKKR